MLVCHACLPASHRPPSRSRASGRADHGRHQRRADHGRADHETPPAPAGPRAVSSNPASIKFDTCNGLVGDPRCPTSSSWPIAARDRALEYAHGPISNMHSAWDRLRALCACPEPRSPCLAPAWQQALSIKFDTNPRRWVHHHLELHQAHHLPSVMCQSRLHQHSSMPST